MRMFRLLVLVGVMPVLYAQSDWPTYGHDSAGQRYSPLTQINTQNVSKLKLAWQYGIDPAAADVNPATTLLPPTEAVPIVVGGILYTPVAPSSILALEPDTGREVWKHELGRARAPTRGVTYWPGDKDAAPRDPRRHERRPADRARREDRQARPGLREGWRDRSQGRGQREVSRPALSISSPGAIYRNLIITGAAGKEGDAEGPAMDIRAWDLHTGKLAWTFHPIPHPGEPGYETWPKDYWMTAGTPANWGVGTVDEQRGLVFLPIGQPAGDYYGAWRKGQNLHSSSVVALDANTGKLKWSFQLTHHDVWDYDVVGRARAGQRRPERQDHPRGRGGVEDRATCSSSIAKRASRSTRSKSGRCRRATCRARKPGRRSRFP